MEELLTRLNEHLVGRLHGPLTFRLLLQPTVAICLAVLAGVRDVRTGKAPYFWALLYHPEHRREMLRDGWKDISKVFVLAFGLDAVYQAVVFRWFYPGEALIVAIILAVLPYLVFRGLVTRIAGVRRGSARTGAGVRRPKD
jgi:hypothetical protein